MVHSVRLARIIISVLILVILVFVGCQRSGQTPTAENSNVQIALQWMPDDETLVVLLTDGNGTPITDATVSIEGNMNHPGMVPVLADPLADDADGSADGRYQFPFAFSMLGDWIITVTVNQADGSSFRRDLNLRSTSDGIVGDSLLPLDGAPATPNSSEGASGDDGSATLHIETAMARPAPLAGGTGAAYFLLHNGGDAAIKLIGADSPAASAVELHTTVNDNGVMRMRQITDGVVIGADGSIELTPGGMHMMLVGLSAPLAEGDTIEVTLHFQGAEDLTFEVPVVNMDDLPAEGEMEHDH